MEDPAKDFVPCIIDPILSTDLKKVNHVVDTYLAHDVVFHHPVFIVEGREEVRRIYVAWSNANKRFGEMRIDAFWQVEGKGKVRREKGKWNRKGRVKGKRAGPVYDPNSNRVVTDITYTFAPTFHPSPNPQSARVVSMFHLCRHPTTGLYTVTRQEDYYPTDRIIGAVTPRPFSALTEGAAWGFMRFNGWMSIYVVYWVMAVISWAFLAIGWKSVGGRSKEQMMIPGWMKGGKGTEGYAVLPNDMLGVSHGSGANRDAIRNGHGEGLRERKGASGNAK
ncbi:hypothetical protein HK101_010786 [Irineochytrium annulatum]|nr:hypothetical protein HK101_010786 [Irineochytrium annulatum]